LASTAQGFFVYNSKSGKKCQSAAKAKGVNFLSAFS
jgi:hypothetical protein